MRRAEHGLSAEMPPPFAYPATANGSDDSPSVKTHMPGLGNDSKTFQPGGNRGSQEILPVKRAAASDKGIDGPLSAGRRTRLF